MSHAENCELACMCDASSDKVIKLKTEEYGLDYVAIYLCFKRGEILS